MTWPYSIPRRHAGELTRRKHIEVVSGKNESDTVNRAGKLIYLAGYLAEIAIRMPHERYRKRASVQEQRITPSELSFLALIFSAITGIPALYIFTPWLRRADYRVSAATRRRLTTAGSILLGAAVWIFRRAHLDLGRSYSPTLQIFSGHTLVTRGIYTYVRHPMYTSLWLWSLAQPMLLHNWIAGWISFATLPALHLWRIPREERMMLDTFGSDYRKYMERTGRILPRFGSRFALPAPAHGERARPEQ